MRDQLPRGSITFHTLVPSRFLIACGNVVDVVSGGRRISWVTCVGDAVINMTLDAVSLQVESCGGEQMQCLDQGMLEEFSCTNAENLVMVIQDECLQYPTHNICRKYILLLPIG